MQKSLPIYNYKHKINTLVANHDVYIEYYTYLV